MSKSIVAVIKCDTYDYEQVYDAVEAGIKLLGGISNFVKEGEKILIKPNVLIGTNPEKCVCTHPSVFRAVGVILKKTNAMFVFIGRWSDFISIMPIYCLRFNWTKLDTFATICTNTLINNWFWTYLVPDKRPQPST